MGHCYVIDRHTGRRSLVCDHCDGPEALLRRCPVRVTYPGGGSLPYCPGADLCAPCWIAVRPTWDRAHDRCRAAAARAERDAQERATGQIVAFTQEG